MSTSLRKQTSASSAIAFGMLLLYSAAAVAEGTGAGNGTGGVQPPLSLEPGSGMGNGTEGPVLPSVPSQDSVTATLNKMLTVVSVQCSFKFDSGLRYEKQGDAYALFREKRESDKLIVSKDSLLSILSMDYETKVSCSRNVKEFTTVDQIEAGSFTAARIDGGVIAKEAVLRNNAVFLSFAYVTDGDRRLYQSTDPDRTGTRQAEELYLELTDNGALQDVALVTPKGWPKNSVVNTTKIKLVVTAVESAKQLAEEQATASILLSHSPLFSFNWKNSDLPAMRVNSQFVLAGIRRGPNGTVPVGQDISVPTQITSAAKEDLGQINRWLQENGAAGLLRSISERPSVIAYLSNAVHDRAVLNQFRARILTPLRPTANASALGRSVYVALLTTFASRAAVTAHAELEMATQMTVTSIGAMNPSYPARKMPASKSLAAPPSLHAVAGSVVLKDEVRLLEGSVGCGEFTCPSLETDMYLLGGLGDAINNNLKLLSSWSFPKEDYEIESAESFAGVDRLSQDGCMYVLKLIRAVAEFHNNYLSYAKELGTDKLHAGHPYLKQIFAVLGDLNEAKYREESPEQFVTKTLQDWEMNCRETTVRDIKEAIGTIRPKSTSRIQRELEKYTVDP